MPSVRVPEAELAQLFDSLDLWHKADAGILTPVEEPGARMPARLCDGGESFFVRLQNAAGLNVARVHYIARLDGRVLRWPSVLLLGEVMIYRTAHD